MITRPPSSSTSTSTPLESVTSRLSRLRAEQRTTRPLFTSPAPPTSTSPGLLLLPSSTPSSIAATTTNKLAGPPAPRSWAAQIARTDAERRATLEREERRGRSRRMLRKLNDVDERTEEGVESLVRGCGRVIVRDLARRGSLYLGLVGGLPPHVRLGLMEVAAVEAPLKEGVIRELLRDDDEVGPEEEEGEAAREVRLEEVGDADWEAGEEQELGRSTQEPYGDWGGTPHRFADTLTSLNLAFSPLSPSFLHSLLLTPLPTKSLSPTRHIPSFPHLQSLTLTGAPNLALDASLTDILTPLLSLRHLRLANIPFSITSISPHRHALNKLAASTPNLVSLDLSYAPGLESIHWRTAVDCMGTIEWGTRWSAMRKLGLRMRCVEGRDADGRIKVAKEVERRIVKSGRKGRWVEVVV